MTHLAVWPLTPAASWADRRFPAQITWINEFPLCSLQDQSNQYGPQISYHGDQSDRWRGSRWRTGGGGGISAFSFDSPPTFTFEIALQCVINNQSKDKWMWSSELLPVGRHIWAVWGFADNRLPWLWFSPAVCTQMMKKQQQLAVNQTVQRWQQACGVGHK